MSMTSLQEWFLTALRTLVPESGQDGAMHRVELWFHGDDQHERIRIFRMEDRDESLSEMPLTLAGEIERATNQHATTMPNGISLRYAVQAYRGRDDTVPETTHYMVVTGTMLPNPGNTQASERGQMIRHNENLHHMMMNLVNSVAGRLSRDLDEERNARQAAERRFSEVILLREEMLDRKHERELEAAREAREAAQKESMLAMVASLAPALIAKLGSGKSSDAQDVPQDAVLRDRAIGSVINSMTADEIQAVAMAVKPERQAALLELIDAYSKVNVKTKGAAVQAPEKRN